MLDQQALFQVTPGGWAPFIPVYPGNKAHSNYRKIIFGGQFVWDAIVEPFAGTGSTALYGRTERRYLGESSNDVRAIWNVWDRGDWGAIQQEIRDYQRMDSPVHAWDVAKGIYEDTIDYTDDELGEWSSLSLAVASLVLRKLAFGGVIRHSRDGELNVSYHESKFPAWQRWKAYAPHPTGVIEIRRDWLCCLRSMPRGLGKNVLTLIDPPYYLPYAPGTERRGTGAMTPAYGNHEPHEGGTLHLCLGAVEYALKYPGRIVVCNYLSNEMHNGILAMAPHATWTDVGTMKRMNNGNGEPRINAVERLWVIENRGT